MLAADPTDSPSNWDFSAALDLLQSPTYTGGSAPAVVRSGSTGPSPKVKEHTYNDVDNITRSQAADLKSQRSYTQLGDFGSLWDLLGQATDATRPPTTEPTKPRLAEPSTKQPSRITILRRSSNKDPSSDDSHAEPSSRTPSNSVYVSNASPPRVSKDHQPARLSTRPRTVTTLKQPSIIKPTGDDAAPKALPSPTPLREITGTGYSEDTPKAKPQPRAGGKGTQAKANDEMISSESSAEADSDSSTIVFERPLSKKSGVLAFVPSQVGTLDARNEYCDTPPSSLDDLDPALNSDNVTTVPASGVVRVRPTAYKSATDRRVGLMTKLLKEFPDYATLVSQVGRAATPDKNSLKSCPIHVFVDMSNIMVGFHDAVKVSRNIPITTRIRRVHMSFANFSKIMERGRPTAKRVLVGSDRLPSIDEADKLGYETNILDRVHKAKHTAPRVRKVPRLAPVESETAAERWVEQGVDEILHLKILESLLDTDEPATIVLATGDAAEAEYSGGFMRMVERALQRGWAVELVSFSQVTSSAYRRKEFRVKWGLRFQVIELDGYIEELFD